MRHPSPALPHRCRTDVHRHTRHRRRANLIDDTVCAASLWSVKSLFRPRQRRREEQSTTHCSTHRSKPVDPPGLGAQGGQSSSFIQRKLDILASVTDALYVSDMSTHTKRANTAKHVRTRVRRGGERFWRHSDFRGLSPAAVSQALSRLARDGELIRVRKGVYFRPRPTVLGPSRPDPSAALASATRAKIHPAGLTAANWLGFTSQNPALAEYASTASSVSKLRNMYVHTGRPPSREALTDDEAALLEFLRDRGETSDLSADATCDRLLVLLRESDSFVRLAQAALQEPPRVRAMLGAAGEQLGADVRLLARLRDSLNGLSRYDFGKLACLKAAKRWQAT